MIRAVDCTIAKRYIVTAIKLRYILALSPDALGQWRKVVASKSYRSRPKGTVIAPFSYRSGNILAVIASESYWSDS